MKSSLLFLFLFIWSALISWWSVERSQNFTQHNVKVFDGVMYEYQQVRRHHKFQENFGPGNRLHSAYNELMANPNAGAYHALLCLFWPESLSNDGDLWLRGTFGLFVFSSLLFLLLRNHQKWLWLSIVLLWGLLPGHMHARYGIGSYIPDGIGLVYLMSGLLALHQFQKSKDKRWFVAAPLLLLLGIGMRLNLFVYTAVMVLPLLWPSIKTLCSLPFQSRLLLWGWLAFTLMGFGLYLYTRFDWFWLYNTQLGYGKTGLGEALTRSFDLFGQLQGAQGIALHLLFLCLGLFVFPKESNSLWRILSLPFVIIYGLSILVLHAPENPHVLNAAFLSSPFFCVSIGQLFSKYLSFPKKLSPAFFGTFLLLCLAGAAISQSLLWSKEKHTQALYLAPKKAGEVLYKESQKVNSIDFKHLFFFDEMLSVPLQTSLYKNHNIWLPEQQSFYFKRPFLEHNASCETLDACIAYYFELAQSMNLIAINHPKGKKNALRADYPFADSTALRVESLLFESGHWKMIDSLSSPIHGSVVFLKNHQKPGSLE